MGLGELLRGVKNAKERASGDRSFSKAKGLEAGLHSWKAWRDFSKEMGDKYAADDPVRAAVYTNVAKELKTDLKWESFQIMSDTYWALVRRHDRRQSRSPDNQKAA